MQAIHIKGLYRAWIYSDRLRPTASQSASSPIRSRRWNLPNAFVLNTLAAIFPRTETHNYQRACGWRDMAMERAEMPAIMQIAYSGRPAWAMPLVAANRPAQGSLGSGVRRETLSETVWDLVRFGSAKCVIIQAPYRPLVIINPPARNS